MTTILSYPTGAIGDKVQFGRRGGYLEWSNGVFSAFEPNGVTPAQIQVPETPASPSDAASKAYVDLAVSGMSGGGSTTAPTPSNDWLLLTGGTMSGHIIMDGGAQIRLDKRGSVFNPALSFNGEISTGIYHDSVGVIGVSVGGKQSLLLSDTTLTKSMEDAVPVLKLSRTGNGIVGDIGSIDFYGTTTVNEDVLFGSITASAVDYSDGSIISAFDVNTYDMGAMYTPLRVEGHKVEFHKNGSAVRPTVTFDGDSDLGFYSDGDNKLSFTSFGIDRLTIQDGNSGQNSSVVFPDSSAITVPSGPTTDRPSVRTHGMLRYNSTLGVFECTVDDGSSPEWETIVTNADDFISSTGGQMDGNLSTNSNIYPTGAAPVHMLGGVGQEWDEVHAQQALMRTTGYAERLEADQTYPTGSVLIIGGSAEITQTNTTAHESAAGIVGDAGIVMNNTPNRPMLLPIVLKGRVDCRVVGTISKGDMIGTSHINGVGTRVTSSAASVGIALEDYNSASEGVISVLAKQFI